MSRWLETPAHVSENPGDLPAGFRAAGVACGLKPSGGLDLGLMVCAAPTCVSAARFTRSGVLEVRDTNYCRISVHADPRTGRIIAFATIDNLWKGAASQAVQNLNLMFGLDEAAGLS